MSTGNYQMQIQWQKQKKKTILERQSLSNMMIFLTMTVKCTQVRKMAKYADLKTMNIMLTLL